MGGFNQFAGLLGSTVLVAVLIVKLPGINRLSPRYKIYLAILVALSLLMPLPGVILAAYPRGIVGDLAITTLIALLLSLFSTLFSWPQLAKKEHWWLWIAVAVAAMTLYPLALGLGMWDPYGLGFGNGWFLLGLLLLALVAFYYGLRLLPVCLGLAVLAWSVGWYESGNLWDYLLDPLLALWSLTMVATALLNRIR